MNNLEVYFDHWCFSKAEESEAMDALIEQQIISDNCLEPADVDLGDAMRAVEWLRARGKEGKAK